MVNLNLYSRVQICRDIWTNGDYPEFLLDINNKKSNFNCGRVYVNNSNIVIYSNKKGFFIVIVVTNKNKVDS